MHSDEEEYIAYRPNKYIQAEHNPNVEDEDEFAYEKALPNFKWSQFMNEYNSFAASDISFKRVQRQAPLDELDDSPTEVPRSVLGPPGREGPEDVPYEIEVPIAPIIGITAVFAVIFIFGPLFVRKGPNKGIVQCSIMLSAFCMWIFWITVFIGQMNPLMGPRLENTTVAWMSVKLGHATAPLPSEGSTVPASTEDEGITP